MVGGHLGATLAHRGAMLAYLEGNVGPSRGYVDPSWAYVSPTIRAYVGPLGPMLAHLGAYVEAMLAMCETISVERPRRCQFFLPGPLAEPKAT